MKMLTKEQVSIIKLARENTINNAWYLLRTAVDLFEHKQYTLSCFLAMTAIEETGKLFVLQMIQGDLLRILYKDINRPLEPNLRELQKFLKSHLGKAIQAASVSLYINEGADRRHGIHPKSGIHRTSGIILLARSGRWMEIRNSCLYTDLDLINNLASTPEHMITPEHAYYFICMAFEVIAEQSSSGYGNSFESGNPETISFWQELADDFKQLLKEEPNHNRIDKLFEEAFENYPTEDGAETIGRSNQFWEERLDDLKNFMERWGDTIDIDKLDFLKDPEPLRKAARLCEARKSAE